MDVVRSLAADRTDINFGAIYENAVAQELACHGFDLAYYKDRKVGELDFVVQSRNRVVPIEVKSGKSYKRHSALTKALATSNWGIERAVVLHARRERRGGWYGVVLARIHGYVSATWVLA
jgi:predicted AAA+ superfamily ATPase